MEQTLAQPRERYIQRQRPRQCTNGIKVGRETTTMLISNPGMIRTSHGVETPAISIKVSRVLEIQPSGTVITLHRLINRKWKTE